MGSATRNGPARLMAAGAALARPLRQPRDAVQFALLPPAVTDGVLVRALAGWSSGIAPPVVRDAYRMLKRRRGMRQCDVAVAIGLSRPQLANAMMGRFGLSADAVARFKAWATHTARASRGAA